ncbi:uncharacterized protein LOC110820596 [Carica papaya]|uniref:uncharacterized protein LOC110820596 n=1 Tax=Carica papaya TaxID=3649 RepID=UPI000B8C9221|nr:uncharacterized protein LOC110820596 [Carica papaya]
MVKMENSQICSSLSFFKASLFYVAVLIFSLMLTCFLSTSPKLFSFLVTIPILGLSTILILSFSKRKKRVVLVENPVSQIQKESQKYEKNSLVETELKQKPKMLAAEACDPNATVQETDQAAEMHEFIVESPISDSESSSIEESITSSEINFELDHGQWIYPNNMGHQNVCSTVSYDSVSEEEDEDSLIEIALRGGDSTDLNYEDQPKQKLQSFLPDSIFRQEEIRELLAEINEDENLIEIDISMGSIKSPSKSLEIEA